MTKQIITILSYNMQYPKYASVIISKGKNEYQGRLAQKLNDPSASSKSYWFILKRFYNGKKVPVIPPLLINNKLESDFEIKANYLNGFFVSKCSPLINNSAVRNSLQYLSTTRVSSFFSMRKPS